jgi:hypothetical protein
VVATLAAAFCLWLLVTRNWTYTGLLLAVMAVGLLLWWPSRRRAVTAV